MDTGGGESLPHFPNHSQEIHMNFTMIQDGVETQVSFHDLWYITTPAADLERIRELKVGQAHTFDLDEEVKLTVRRDA